MALQSRIEWLEESIDAEREIIRALRAAHRVVENGIVYYQQETGQTNLRVQRYTLDQYNTALNGAYRRLDAAEAELNHAQKRGGALGYIARRFNG